MESKIYLGHYQTKVWTPNQNLSNIKWSPRFILGITKLKFGLLIKIYSIKMESKIYLGHYQTKVWTPNQNLNQESNG